ncbi:hypothetical protein [Mycobacterium sp.]|uniref:hypothetical protein n=1 Tax=Mycobacterium sp. TaxID=1785 RepID=UPI003BAB0222
MALHGLSALSGILGFLAGLGGIRGGFSCRPRIGQGLITELIDLLAGYANLSLAVFSKIGVKAGHRVTKRSIVGAQARKKRLPTLARSKIITTTTRRLPTRQKPHTQPSAISTMQPKHLLLQLNPTRAVVNKKAPEVSNDNFSDHHR